MEMYKKPVMEIVELEKVDVLTCSQGCIDIESGENCTHLIHSINCDSTCQPVK